MREIGDHLTGVRPSFDAEYRVLARDGRWHTIVDRGRVVDRTPDGRPVRMVGIKADVTVARSVEQARQAAEQRFREIFDSGFQYQLLLDHAGAVIEVNQHALNQYAVDRGQVRGRLVWDTLWWADNRGLKSDCMTPWQPRCGARPGCMRTSSRVPVSDTPTSRSRSSR